MRDAYTVLFKKYPREEFFKDSLNDIIFISPEKLRTNWEERKRKLFHNEELYIRGYGRDAAGTNFYLELYKHLFGHDKIRKDPTNNAQPSKIMESLTPYSKTITTETKGKERIQNYQISHIFGKTKNPLLFTAAWNIAYVPKFLDPFTGHESQGEYRDDFRALFIPTMVERFRDFIQDYNDLVVKAIAPNLEVALEATRIKFDIDETDYKRFKADAIEQLSPIKERN